MQAQDPSYNVPPFPPFPAASRYIPLGSIEEAMDRICRSVDAMEAISMVIGPPGTGKSLVCSLLAQQYAETHEVVNLGEIPVETRKEFLTHLLHRLGVDGSEMTNSSKQLALMDRVCGDHSKAGGVLMIIDEAQSLPREVIEAIRTVTNISRTGTPRIFAVMCGSAKVDEILAEPSMEAFTQRVATRCYLHPMNSEETRYYISETIRSCGADPEETVTAEAMAAVHHACSGVPRLINQMMMQAIDCAAENEQTLITEQIIDQAWAELQQLPSPMIEEPRITSESNSPVEFGELSDIGDVSDFSEPASFGEVAQDDQYGGSCQFADLNDSLDFAEAPKSEIAHAEPAPLGCLSEEIEVDSGTASWVEEPVAEEMPETPAIPSSSDLFGHFEDEETLDVGSTPTPVAARDIEVQPAGDSLEMMLQQEIVSFGSIETMDFVKSSAEEVCETAEAERVEAEYDEACESSVIAMEEESSVLPMPSVSEETSDCEAENLDRSQILRIRDDSDILVIEDEVELRTDSASSNSDGVPRQQTSLDFQSMLSRMRTNA